MFEDVDIRECVKSSLVVTGYLVLTVGILFTISHLGYIDTDLFTGISLQMAVLGTAVIFNLVFAFTVMDENQ